MRIPSGDLVPARRHRYAGGYGRRRRRRTIRLLVLGVLLLGLGVAGFWLTRDEARSAPVALVGVAGQAGVLQCGKEVIT